MTQCNCSVAPTGLPVISPAVPIGKTPPNINSLEMISRVFSKQVFKRFTQLQFPVRLHDALFIFENLSNCSSQFHYFFFFKFHFWRRVFNIWSNCGGTLMHNLSQVSSSTLGSQKAMFLHDEAIIMYLGLNCTHCTGPVWSPLSTQTLVPFSAFQMWTRPSVEPEITN